jgi:UDP-N-acetylmuramoylalanine--D-glutamate ligase
MIIVSAYARRKVGVFGLGKAGDATIASLLAGGAEVFAADDSEASCARTAEKFKGKITVLPFAQWPWAELAKLVLSPGVPYTHPKPHAVVAMAEQHGCRILGDIELLYRACPQAKYVAITGTNGKSTTTTLIGHILQAAGLKVQVGGNLGTAALSLESLGSDGIYVLELSSYQLDLVRSTRFHVAAFLNVTPDHLDRHGDMEGYIAAKMHMFERQEPEDFAVVAVDDGYTHAIADALHAQDAAELVRVSTQKVLQGGVYVKDGVLHDVDMGLSFTISGIVTLTGAHNWQNAAVAYAVAKSLGVQPGVIFTAMQSFGGLRHRLQQVAVINGVRFINDSKATNADATRHALAPYDAIYWIAGGKAKAGGIESLEALFPNVSHAFLIGAAEDDFAQTLEGKVAFTRCGTLAKAVAAAAEMAFAEGKQGAVVLLSPACASFDQWKSFEERGDAFCTQVEALARDVDGGKRHAS